jgi:hypothetical protein
MPKLKRARCKTSELYGQPDESEAVYKYRPSNDKLYRCFPDLLAESSRGKNIIDTL